MGIVKINISVTNPPKPSKLLQSGVIVSNGGTSLATNEVKLITSQADANAITLPAQSMTSIKWASGTVTVNFASPLPAIYGSTVDVVISGVVPDAYNGTYTASIVTSNSSNRLTYSLADDPGTATTMGQVISTNAQSLKDEILSFWGQGKGRSAYVLELGGLSTSDAVTSLFNFIDTDISSGIPYQKYFTYLVPRSWSDETSFVSGTGRYTSEEDLVYFLVNCTTANYAQWAATGNKSVVAIITSPDADDSERPAANVFQSILTNDPGSSNMVPPMAYRFMYGATPYPPAGNGALLTALNDANISYIAPAAEGGLSNKMLVKGHCLDGKPFGYWYAIAWTAINLSMDLANEVINGSNTTLNPLYYDQRGIERLQRRGLKTLRSGVSYGLLLGSVVGASYTQDEFIDHLDKGDFAGSVVINAIPFASYTSLNPNDYDEGVYGGLSAVITPRRGFESITFNLNVTNFVGA